MNDIAILREYVIKLSASGRDGLIIANAINNLIGDKAELHAEVKRLQNRIEEIVGLKSW